MEILRTISFYVEGKNMPFLIIGGHALNAYGFSRQTGDLDLLVPRADKTRWLELMSRLNYIKGQDNEYFVRFSAENLANWPIDLMFVDSQTFDKLLANSTDALIGVANARIVSIKHLALLKIHALKIYQEHRYNKDYADLVYLLKTGKTGMNKDDLHAACVKYANLELFEKLSKELSYGS